MLDIQLEKQREGARERERKIPKPKLREKAEGETGFSHAFFTSIEPVEPYGCGQPAPNR